MLELRKIDETNYWKCLSLQVAKSQENFVAPNAVSLAEAYVFGNKVFPFAIYSNDLMIGFVMIDHEIEHDEIWRLMIDENFQGKGYGKSALNLTISWIKEEFPKRDLFLSVELENKRAIQLYKNAGFSFTGSVKDGEAVMKLVEI